MSDQPHITPDVADRLIRDSQMRDPRTPAAVAAGITEGLHPDVIKAFMPACAPSEVAPAGDAVDKITVMRRLHEFVRLPEDAALTDPMALVTELYKRVRLVTDIKAVEEGTSWDYCKATSIDWLRGIRRWIPVHRAAWDYQIGCVPPVFQQAGVFACGEAYSGPFHLTFFNPRGERYYCCLLKRSQVLDREFFSKIPFADELPMLGIPDKKEVAP